MFCACAPYVEELTLPELAVLLLCELGVSVAVLLLPTALDELDDGCCCAVWSDVIAPLVPPVAGCEELPIAADELEHESDSMFTLETVIALLPVLALADPALVWAPADAPPAMLPMICTW